MHRYGRHGPRAWLKWRKRHYVPLSFVPVPVHQKLVVFRIRIPQEAERVLVVLDQPDETPEVTIVSNFPVIQRLPEPEPYENDVKTTAKRQADNYVIEIQQRQQQDGTEIVIHQQRLEREVKKEAGGYFSNHTLLPDDSREEVIQLYCDTYLQQLSVSGLTILVTEKDHKLFHLAQQDSISSIPLREDGRVAYHKEYGYIIRALEVMGVIPEGTFEILREYEPHDLADKYSHFCKYHERIEVEPREDPFRRRSY